MIDKDKDNWKCNIASIIIKVGAIFVYMAI